MIVVIADDITGAAEIGGICVSYGLKTGLTTEIRDIREWVAQYDVVVIATDTRGMGVEDACACTRRIAALLNNLPDDYNLFKKTDSALRGHITAELGILLAETKYRRAQLLPQNPSKGRVVEDGVYKINGMPLSETGFAYDPEFPAVTSVVKERLCLDDDMTFCDAVDDDGVRRAVSRIGNDTLPAGAADYFKAYIEKLAADGMLQLRHDGAAAFGGLEGNTAIVVCGSTQSGDLSSLPYINKLGANVLSMTREAFYGTDVSVWEYAALEDYRHRGSIVLTIGFPPEGGADFALRLRRQMGELCALLIAESQPEELVVEGGATAFAVLGRLGWQSFAIENEIAPGVIRLRYTTERGPIYITMKPGSYPWGDTFGDGKSIGKNRV